ncbi:MAG: hypothetical protein IPK57_02755 [Chitinophagaceae bacterium]|nr:hypothetical protein [Chitinophagaceae bacterium]
MGALWNRTWDAVSLPGNNYALSTAAGFYLLDEKSRVRYRFDAYRENDIGNRLTRYGRNFFRYSENELLLYNEEAGLSYFNLERREFKPIKPDDKSFGVFTHPRSSDVDHWVFSSQISATEFIFVQYSRDSIFYYDKLRNLRKATALPFRSDYFGWNSNLTLLNDSTILVNMADKGFISFRLDRETGKIFFNPQHFFLLLLLPIFYR